MIGWWLQDLFNGDLWVAAPPLGLYAIFSLWMVVHAIENREWMWVFLILCGLGIWYFLYMYRTGSAAMSGFELPGAAKRQRIKELESQIHHIDNAVHHFQLGDVYFRTGKLAKAEVCYRASLERDPEDIDARAHLGQCLLRQKRAAEARPILEKVCVENPKHDYGYSLMALAETRAAMNEPDAALAAWLQVTTNHSYPRAKVQLAELYLAKSQIEPARSEINDVLADDPHAPRYQRRRDRVWVGRARALKRKIGGN
jgi:tetratricopeptide (TPR) repeat protein